MNNVETFELIKWTDAHVANTVYNLSGSAPVPLTIKGLTALSSDPEATARNLGSLDSIPLGLSSHPLIRQNIAETIFPNSKAGITAEHVLTTVGSTGGNALIIQCLLQPGEHVIVQYPTFAQLLGIPKALPRVDVSLWKMDPSKGWDADIDQLRGLIRKGKTKLIILNNPHNPTGYSLPTEQCREIVRLAKENDVWLHVDEIFRPLFHEPGADASSFMEYTSEHSKIVVTGSVSKAWALAGLRVGWIVTKEKSVLDACYNMISYTFNECGTLDEIIAAEALSSRCRDNILTRTLDQAQTNISLLEKFVQRNNKTVSWTKPTAGATAFVQFFKDKRPVNDVDFCEKLKASTGVLLVPGSLCFGDGPKETGGQEGQDINGFVRWHLTGSTEVMEKGIALIEAFLRDGFDAVQTAGSLFLPRI